MWSRVRSTSSALSSSEEVTGRIYAEPPSPMPTSELLVVLAR
jgi:hypothetical protein